MHFNPRRPFVHALLALVTAIVSANAGSIPERDLRATTIETLDTPRSFPLIRSTAEWRARASQIRLQAQVSCGLWPLPEKGPLGPVVSGKITRDGYSVEKVYFQTYPGFYLAGNLYRPAGQGQGPFPSILNPHGHWAQGRLTDAEDGSIPARCINFAKRGIVAFCYDMVGYNDTIQIPEHRRFATNPACQLWNISLMGLQTWNSIRALDYIGTLPDVDPARIGCTGASGGGTQTFMLACLDDRVAVSAPIVMVSHSMQGGCLCENAPGLRVDFSNMEIAAAAAARPQILVAAAGDWTKTTPVYEGPAIAEIYRLLGQTERFRYRRYDFGHNYNRTTREAVYAWFAQWLLHQPNEGTLPELPYQKETDQDLRVWPDGKLPANAVSDQQLIANLIAQHHSHWQALRPTDSRSLKQFKARVQPVWSRLLQLHFPTAAELWIQRASPNSTDDLITQPLYLGRIGKGDRLPALLCSPAKQPLSTCIILVHPDGKQAFVSADGRPRGLAAEWVDHRYPVLMLDTFLTGELADPKAQAARNYWTNFFPVYNRTDLQERVQDLVTAITLARTQLKAKRVVLCGTGRAGLWALLAAPAADAVIADADQADLASDASWLAQDLFVPGIRLIGGVMGAVVLAAPHPLLIHNLNPRFETDWIRSAYTAARTLPALRLEQAPIDARTLVDWIR
jgi:dienelactone hydrolase